MLIACSSLPDLQRFKQDFAAAFDSTDDGEATDYLGCEIIRDWKAGTITICHQGYILHMLKACCATAFTLTKTQLTQGDPALHRQYCRIIGFVSFMV